MNDSDPHGTEEPPPAPDTSEDPGSGDERETPPPRPPRQPPAETEPSAEEFHHRHPDALRLELMVGGAIATGLSLAAFLLATLLITFAGLPAAILLIALALTLLLVFTFLVFPRWRHRRYLYRAGGRGLELRKGVWWRSHRFIPHTRLQHTDVAQGPLERKLGLANLVIHTAGTHEARTTVNGLSLETATELRDRLTGEAEGAGADGV